MGLAKTFIAATLGITMATTPLMAQSAAPLSLTGSVERIGASMSGASDLDKTSMYGLGLIAIMTAIIVLSGGGDREFANSP